MHRQVRLLVTRDAQGTHLYWSHNGLLADGRHHVLSLSAFIDEKRRDAPCIHAENFHGASVAARAAIGLVFQSPSLDKKLTVIWLVAAGLADRCTLQVSYAIGVAKPLSIYVDTHGTGAVDEAAIERAVAECMDLTPRGIRTALGLNKAIYARTSAYGHFGREATADGGFSWERTDLVEALKKAVK